MRQGILLKIDEREAFWWEGAVVPPTQGLSPITWNHISYNVPLSETVRIQRQRYCGLVHSEVKSGKILLFRNKLWYYSQLPREYPTTSPQKQAMMRYWEWCLCESDAKEIVTERGDVRENQSDRPRNYPTFIILDTIHVVMLMWKWHRGFQHSDTGLCVTQWHRSV